MKKFLMLMFTMVLSLTLCACGDDATKEKEKEEEKEEVKEEVESKTCSIDMGDGSKQSITLGATDNEIDKLEMVLVYDSTYLGTDISSFNDDQKEIFKTTMLQTLGYEKNKYDGFEINIDITDVVTVTIKAELKVADPALLENIGMDFSNADMDFDTAIEDMIESGADCK